MPSKVLTVQFHSSPAVRLPAPLVVIWLFAFLLRPVVLPERFSTPFLYQYHSTANVLFSKSPGVALHTRLLVILGEVGEIVGPVMLGALLPTVTLLLLKPE